MVRKCAYCGNEVHKPKTVSNPAWKEKRIVFCDKKCFGLSKRVDAMSYMGKSLLIEGIGVRQFWKELRRWCDCGMNLVVEANHGGIKPVLQDRQAEDVVKRIGVAFLEFCPDMELGHMQWDYRMVLQPVRSEHWVSDMSGRTQLKKALQAAELSSNDFVNVIEETLEDCASAKMAQLENLDKACRLLKNDLEDYDFHLLYGQTQWKMAIFHLLKEDSIRAETALYMADVLYYLGHNVDYRMLLPEMQPSDFIKLKLKWQKKLVNQ